jgi:hypothetical protein
MEILSGRLWIGDVSMYEAVAKPEADQWFVVHACKEPYHRKELGYTGRAAPKEHPEYLICRRPGRLILNLIDPPNQTRLFLKQNLCTKTATLPKKQTHCSEISNENF